VCGVSQCVTDILTERIWFWWCYG